MKLTNIYIVTYSEPDNWGYQTDKQFFTTLEEARKEVAKLLRELRELARDTDDDISISLYRNDIELGYWRNDFGNVVSYVNH